MNARTRWLSWSWRDLRGHWSRVVVIALIIALGTGAYAGLMSNARWRQISADHNYELLGMYDLRIRLAGDSQVPEGALVGALEQMDHPEWIAAAQERLIVSTQVDASTDGEAILVRGVVIGVPIETSHEQRVNAVHPAVGRALTSDDDGAPVALLERNFAMFYDLPEQGALAVGGGHSLEWVGHGITPEFFIVQPEGDLFFSQANYAAVLTSLATAQAVTNSPASVNDLVVRLSEDADPALAAAEIEGAFAVALPNVGTTINTTSDDLVYTTMYEDIDNDQLFFTVLAVIIFAGAVAAAFNLTNRLVEQQRREIGIAMALGVPQRRIALRPMLVGLQIAVLGVAFGVFIGWLITQGMRTVLIEFLPFAVWMTPFQTDVFAAAAAVGFVVPLVATAIPVWRAVRVRPVDAIRTGHLAARGGGLAPLIRRIPMPGDTFAKMPFRNLVRAPRRAALTVLGIAAALSALVMIFGAIDSFVDTIDRGAAVATSGQPDRVIVDLDRVYPFDDPAVTSVTGVAGADRTETGLVIGATLIGDQDVTVAMRFLDFDAGMFRPAAQEGELPTQGEVLLSAKAASDVGVAVGDQVMIEHPLRQGPLSFTLVESPYVVSGIHDHPFRIYAYLAHASATDMGLEGLVNTVDIQPSAGTDVADLQRSLFASSAVASVQRADAQATIIRDFLDTFIGIFQLFAGVVLLLVVLIAFNAAGIGVEERRREHATMFAFGVPRRRVVRITVVESLTIGLLATGLGILGGLALLFWFVTSAAPQSMPEIGLAVVLSPASVVVAVVAGVLAVGLSPLLTAPRRLRKMDVPSTLRVME